jgi:DNA repair protein RadC
MSYDMPEVQIKYRTGNVQRQKIEGAEDSYNVFRGIFDEDTIDYDESVFVVFTNRALYTIGYFKVSQGGLSGTVVDPKKIFSVALQSGATGLIIAHNHPSGNLKPSVQDKELTTKLQQGAKILDLTFYDHLIITSDNYYSFNEEGLI